MTRPISLAVLIASHNRKQKTLDCLASLAAQDTGAAIHVVLVDDGSSDGTAEAVRHLHPRTEILRADGQAFWSGGMRIAFDHALKADADFYLWLNDDVVLAPHALDHLLATHADLAGRGQSLCVIGGAVADPRTGNTSYAGISQPFARRPLRFRRCLPDPHDPRSCDTLLGNVVLIPRETARIIGSFDPVYRHTLGDLDYVLRVKAAGGWVGLAAGHVGHCSPNEAGNRWFNPRLGLAARWRLVNTPLGMPVRPWLAFARRHGGRLWPLFAPLPYWRLFVPPWIARLIDRVRLPQSHIAPSPSFRGGEAEPGTGAPQSAPLWHPSSGSPPLSARNEGVLRTEEQMCRSDSSERGKWHPETPDTDRLDEGGVHARFC